MKIIVIGLGSMGKRRIRLISEYKHIEIFGIDTQESRREEVSSKFGIKCYADIDSACKVHKVDAAIISTSPLSHAAIIKDCLMHNLHVFTEINLVQDGYDENIKLANDKGLILFLSSTPLYRKETRKIIERIQSANCRLNYIYHKGQYLPDWHPWESYNNYFIGNPRTNGCREIFAIELPWLVTAFGSIESFYVEKSKNTNLDINYMDNYIVVLNHKSGAKGVLVVDVVSRKPYRRLDVYGEEFQLSWNGTLDSLVEYDVQSKEDIIYNFGDEEEHVAGYASYITENPYRDELKVFFKKMDDMTEVPAWDFERDKVILDIIDKIEKS